jgi:hypothetical protein
MPVTVERQAALVDVPQPIEVFADALLLSRATRYQRVLVGASQVRRELHQVAALGPNPPYGKPRKIACSKMLVLQGSLASLFPYGKHLIYV